MDWDKVWMLMQIIKGAVEHPQVPELRSKAMQELLLIEAALRPQPKAVTPVSVVSDVPAERPMVPKAPLFPPLEPSPYERKE